MTLPERLVLIRGARLSLLVALMTVLSGCGLASDAPPGTQTASVTVVDGIPVVVVSARREQQVFADASRSKRADSIERP